MKRSQQGATIAVVAIGLIVLAVGAVILISQLLEERVSRRRLEQETAELRQEIENLKARPMSWGWTGGPGRVNGRRTARTPGIVVPWESRR